jgi:hypothetical protein
MKDLDSHAKAIVEAARDADTPSAADRIRIKRAVLAQIVVGTTVASSAVAGSLSLGAKVGLTVLAVSLVGGGTVGVLKMYDAHQASIARMRVPARTAVAPRPAPALPAVSQEATVSQEPPVLPDEKARKLEKPRKAISQNGRGEKATDEDRLNAEVALLKRAREELRMHRPESTLETLAEYDRLFGRGILVEERQAIAAIALCQAEPGPAARAQAEAFMRRAPASPLRERVRAACITPSGTRAP